VKNILVINGNPARERTTLDASLAEAYAKGAEKSGYKIKQVALATLTFDPVLHEGYNKDQPLEPDLHMLRDEMLQAEHWVLVFPIWLGLPPALVKGFLERTITRGFAFEYQGNRPVALPVLKGKSVHIIITCGMPRFMYRWLSGQPTSKALRTLFKLCGMTVTGITVCGSVAEHSPEALKRYGRYIDTVRQLGEGGK
jgi:putative NADPH-quinone reductase